LPVTQYTKSAANEFANKFLKDNHTVIVHVGTLNVNVNIIFEYVKVLPESVPATFELQHMAIIKKADKELTDVEKHHNEDVRELFAELNQDNKIGTIDGRYFVQKRILHVSIGEGTTEYPLTKHIEFDPNFIRGSNNGIGHAIDKALDEFKQETNLLNYSRQKYSAVLKDRSHKYSEAALDIVSGYIEEESEEILHHIKTEIQRANNEVDIIVVYGGGSILMKEHLKSKIETVSSKADIKLFYVPEKFAVTLEAKGMYEFTTSKIYKALKSKYLSVNK
jgi:plasmid segregation protein ParM